MYACMYVYIYIYIHTCIEYVYMYTHATLPGGADRTEPWWRPARRGGRRPPPPKAPDDMLLWLLGLGYNYFILNKIDEMPLSNGLLMLTTIIISSVSSSISC